MGKEGHKRVEKKGRNVKRKSLREKRGVLVHVNHENIIRVESGDSKIPIAN